MQEMSEVDAVMALATTQRVAEEAMRLLTPEQLVALRHRLDELDPGEED